ncbi:MAG: hypothetical protein PHU12_00420 [Candidatus Aenigmarchaeota archaeon]|nr:hypothetical protein [Candidatus Aenigmarchaeota archaeon]
MVWARTKLVIEDSLIRPRDKIFFDYKGKNPHKFYEELPKLMATVFRIHSENIHEKKFSVTKGDPEKIKAEWEIVKDLDKFSYYIIYVSVDGQSSKGHGAARVTVEALLRTEYPQDTYWQRSLLYEILRMFWHKFFYTSKRHTYVDEGRGLITVFLDDIKSMTRV